MTQTKEVSFAEAGNFVFGIVAKLVIFVIIPLLMVALYYCLGGISYFGWRNDFTEMNVFQIIWFIATDGLFTSLMAATGAIALLWFFLDQRSELFKLFNLKNMLMQFFLTIFLGAMYPIGAIAFSLGYVSSYSKNDGATFVLGVILLITRTILVISPALAVFWAKKYLSKR